MCCGSMQPADHQGATHGASMPGVRMLARASSDCVSEEAAAAAGVLCCLAGLESAGLEEAVTSTGVGDPAVPSNTSNTSCGCGANCKCCSGEGWCAPGAAGGGAPVQEAVQQRLQMVDVLLQLTQPCVMHSVGTGCCSDVLEQARALLQDSQGTRPSQGPASGRGCSGAGQLACGSSSSGGEEFSQGLQRLLQQLQQQQQRFAPGAFTAAAADPLQQLVLQQQQQQPPMVPPPPQAPPLLPDEQAMEACGGGARPGFAGDVECLSGVEPEGLGDLRINSGNSNEMNNAERLAALQQLPEGCPTPRHPEGGAMEWGPEEEAGFLEPPSKRRMRQPGLPGGEEV